MMNINICKNFKEKKYYNSNMASGERHKENAKKGLFTILR